MDVVPDHAKQAYILTKSISLLVESHHKYMSTLSKLMAYLDDSLYL